MSMSMSQAMSEIWLKYLSTTPEKPPWIAPRRDWEWENRAKPLQDSGPRSPPWGLSPGSRLARMDRLYSNPWKAVWSLHIYTTCYLPDRVRQGDRHISLSKSSRASSHCHRSHWRRVRKYNNPRTSSRNHRHRSLRPPGMMVETSADESWKTWEKRTPEPLDL